MFDHSCSRCGKMTCRDDELCYSCYNLAVSASLTPRSKKLYVDNRKPLEDIDANGYYSNAREKVE